MTTGQARPPVAWRAVADACEALIVAVDDDQATETVLGHVATRVLAELHAEPGREHAGPSWEALRESIDHALGESTDSCARCKTCERQTDAVMTVFAPAGPSREALEALAAEHEADAAEWPDSARVTRDELHEHDGETAAYRSAARRLREVLGERSECDE